MRNDGINGLSKCSRRVWIRGTIMNQLQRWFVHNEKCIESSSMKDEKHKGEFTRLFMCMYTQFRSEKFCLHISLIK